MAGDLVIKLFDPIETVSGMVHEAVFREPNGRDFMALGNPFQFAGVESGHVVVERDDVIREYMERCVRSPLDAVTLGTMSLTDSIQCREKFLGFFASARRKISDATSTSSSST